MRGEETRHGLSTAARLGVLAAFLAAMGGVLWLGWDYPVTALMRKVEPTAVGKAWAWAAYWLGQGGLQIAACLLLLAAGLMLKRPAVRLLGGSTLAAVVASGLLTQVFKHLLGRPRPRLDFTDWQMVGFSLDSDLHSFPSGHAATCFALAAVLAGRWPKAGPWMYGLAAFVSAGRVVGTSHYLSDVLGGAALGLLIGWPLARLAYGPKGAVALRKEQLKAAGALLLVLVTAGALFLGGLGAMPLTDRDEGEYAASVMAMEQSGDYVVPTLNGVNYLEKPILSFWAIAAANRLLGPGEEAARLPSALAAWLLVLAVGMLVWRVSGQAGLAAAAAAATAFTPLFGLVARACLTDMLLALWTTSSLALFFLASEKEHPAGRPLYWLAWAALGLGFLTKGPVAPAVVLPTALIYALATGRFLTVLKRSQIPLGILIFLVINAPWYGLVLHRLGDEFWQAFFVSQNLRRFSEVLLGHGGGLFYYFPVILLGAFPFSAAAVPELFGSLIKTTRAVRLLDPVARLRILAAIAVLVVFVVFSLAATKQINYILPALPFLGILAGAKLWRMGRGQPAGRLAGRVLWWGLAVLGGLWVAVLLAVPAGVPLFWEQILGSIRFDSSEYALPAQAPWLILWPLAAAAVLGLALWLGRRLYRQDGADRLLPALALGGALFSGVLLIGLFGQAAAIIQTPAKKMARAVAAKAPADSVVVTYGLWKPSLIFYSGRELPRVRVDQGDRLAKDLSAAKPVFVYSRQRLTDKLEAAGAQVIQPFGGYLLAGNDAAAELWRGAPPATEKPPAASPTPQPDAAPAPQPEPQAAPQLKAAPKTPVATQPEPAVKPQPEAATQEPVSQELAPAPPAATAPQPATPPVAPQPEAVPQPQVAPQPPVVPAPAPATAPPEQAPQTEQAVPPASAEESKAPADDKTEAAPNRPVTTSDQAAEQAVVQPVAPLVKPDEPLARPVKPLEPADKGETSR